MDRVILDCDPGHDDAVALAILLAADTVTLLGVVTSAGNQTLEKTSKNARNLLELMGRNDVPVYRGRGEPLLGELIVAADVHGESGIDGAHLPESTAPVNNTHYLDFYRSSILDGGSPITLAVTGPMTNIAALIVAHPEVVPRIRRVIFMSGACFGENITSSAEFNAFVDPEALQIVIKSGIPIVMMGLDVTLKAQFFHEDVASLRALSNTTGPVFADLLDFFFESNTPPLLAAPNHVEGLHMHDACVAAYIVCPDMFTMLSLPIEVETREGPTRGMTIVDHTDRTFDARYPSVGFEVNRELFASLIINSISALR